MLRLDKTATRKTTLPADQDVEDVFFWLIKTPEERITAVETIRQQTFAFYLSSSDEGQLTQARLQRLCRITKRLQGYTSDYQRICHCPLRDYGAFRNS